MAFEELPGGVLTPPRPLSSPAKVVVGHILWELRRPGRSRNRAITIFLAAATLILFILGKRHVDDIQQTASHFGTYVPSTLSEAFAPYHVVDDGRWDDEISHSNDSTPSVKPKFHLLIPAKTQTVNLCKTLLSAAILNYPPPTLIEFELEHDNEKQDEHQGQSIQQILDFLNGKEAQDDDLILVVEDDSWLQLPAEVTISRFFHGMRDSSDSLLKQYGRLDLGDDEIPMLLRPQKYTHKVLFGAQKECPNAPDDPACYSVPQSPLPSDIYGFETDKHPEGKYNRPRYMSSKMVMGQVTDMRPIYERAAQLLKDHPGITNSQDIFSQILGEQEYQRTIYQESQLPKSKWNSWLTSKLGQSTNMPAVKPKNMTTILGRNYEFGIGLDYYSSIFQVMNNSADDVRFVKFSTPSLIISPSKHAASTFKDLLHLPPDLNFSASPFALHTVSTKIPDPPFNEIDALLPDPNNTSWNDVNLATNVIVPGSSVPATLNFHGDQSTMDLLDEWWPKIWFQEHGRALLRQYMRSPDGPIAAEAAADGGDRWWDLRGGKGGVWTGRGEWLEWREVCGKVDGLSGGQTVEDVLFGDGWGVYGKEKVGGKPVFDKFGKLVSGVLDGDGKLDE
ncbi:Legume-like lectin family protein [Rutstroemia sp. NJR-2017a BBW]|nr:Legume-like lectin family protein [Rutstroemia sp. NJR-2017a BBW]PQE08708.1 Legume-like lectin family protein [Rutstroemia sp. NJR-2017a BBW]